MKVAFNKAKVYMIVLPLSLVTLLVSFPAQQVNAQIAIVEVIKAGIKKVIKAIDLKVQRLQNQTIWLQNAQKVLENQLSKLKLTEIADWSDKQKELYAKYFDELWRIRAVIGYYHRIKEITNRQVQIVAEYNRARGLFAQDRHFTTAELSGMDKVYSGILDASLKNLDQLFIVVNSFKTQMGDAARLELINKTGAKMDQTYNDLRSFNQQQVGLSLQRAKETGDVNSVKKLYGVE
jgi:hypothetical protein